MKKKLTLTAIRNLQPTMGSNGRARDAFLWSMDISGLGVKVTPAGRRVFVFQYRPRNQHNKEKRAPVRLTLGAFGTDLTLHQAEGLARDLRLAVQAGEDPRELNRQRQAEADQEERRTMEALAQKYLERLPRKRKKKTGEPLRASTLRHYRQMVRVNILPRIGKLKVAEVALSDLEKLHDSMSDRPYQANRVLCVLNQMLDLAERLEWRPLNSNPTHHVDRKPERGRARNQAVMLRPEQIRALLEAISAEREEGADLYALAAIEICFWLGWRLRSEVLPLQWADIDLERKVALLRRTKGAETEYRAMPDEVVEILRGLPREANNPHVFPGKTAGQHRTTVRKIWYRIRERAGLTDLPGIGSFRRHDLRHNAVSWHLAAGADLKLAGRLVGHRSQQATEIYSHFLTEHLSEAANVRSQAMKEAVAGSIDESNQPD